MSHVWTVEALACLNHFLQSAKQFRPFLLFLPYTSEPTQLRPLCNIFIVAISNTYEFNWFSRLVCLV